MITPREIKHAIETLPLSEREAIADWLRERSFTDATADSVREPALAYANPLLRPMTVAEYVELEERSTLRHEYINGAIYAMAGVSRAHNLISLELAFLLKKHLQGGPCRVFSSDLKLHLKTADDEIFYYPDVLVACDRRGWGEHFVHNPKLVVEVLSPSTQGTDLREKALNYRRLPSLEEYVIASQGECRITVQRRAQNWVPQAYAGPEAILELRSIGLTVPLYEVYAQALGDQA